MVYGMPTNLTCIDFTADRSRLSLAHDIKIMSWGDKKENWLV